MVRLEELERQGRVEVIRPLAPLPASRLSRDRERIVQTLELGRRATRCFLEAGPVPRELDCPSGALEAGGLPPASQPS
jgi:hypothetical protein